VIQEFSALYIGVGNEPNGKGKTKMANPQKFKTLLTGVIFSIDELGAIPLVKVYMEGYVFGDNDVPFNAIWLKSGIPGIIKDDMDVYPLAIETSLIEDFEPEPDPLDPVNRVSMKPGSN
jgi:hypothetical protein